MEAIEVHAVTPERWDDLAELFQRLGPRGGRQDPANCWCSVWRTTQRSAEENRTSLCGLVEAGQVPGLLGYREGTPVGWVSVAARAHFPGLQRSRQFCPPDDDPGVWVISCPLGWYLDAGFAPVREVGKRTVVRKELTG